MKPQRERATFYARTEHLSQAFRNAGQRDREGMMTMQAQYEAEFSASNNGDHQREGMAAGVHRVIDDCMRTLTQQQPVNAERIACRKGCAHCCHIPVFITPDEAKLLHMVAADSGVVLDAAKLRTQAMSNTGGLWAKLAPQWRRCAFLGDDNACTVYEWRPAACRKYQVLDSAENCDSIAKPGARVLNFVSIPAEVVTSAAYGVFGSGLMAQQLLATWPEEKQ